MIQVTITREHLEAAIEAVKNEKNDKHHVCLLGQPLISLLGDDGFSFVGDTGTIWQDFGKSVGEIEGPVKDLTDLFDTGAYDILRGMLPITLTVELR